MIRFLCACVFASTGPCALRHMKRTSYFVQWRKRKKTKAAPTSHLCFNRFKLVRPFDCFARSNFGKTRLPYTASVARARLLQTAVREECQCLFCRMVHRSVSFLYRTGEKKQTKATGLSALSSSLKVWQFWRPEGRLDGADPTASLAMSYSCLCVCVACICIYIYNIYIMCIYIYIRATTQTCLQVYIFIIYV